MQGGPVNRRWARSIGPYAWSEGLPLKLSTKKPSPQERRFKQQKTPKYRGSFHSFFPSSCGHFRRNWHPFYYFIDGLPGFTGPFPSTSLDENKCCVCSIVRCLLYC